jgi:hypothetical protein
MSDIVPWLAFVGVIAAIVSSLAWLASRTRRRGVGREIMGPVDLIYRPHTHQINLEIQVQEESMVAMPPLDDQWRRSRAKAGQPDAEGPTSYSKP